MSARGFFVVVTLLLAVTGCASRGKVARPSPFPNAPVTAAPTRVDSPSPDPASVLAASPPPGQPGLLVGPPPPLTDLIKTAASLRGVPYRSGGDSPAIGFDCSGFVHYVFSVNSVELPRTVGEQFVLGWRIGLESIRQGDLVFFSTTDPGPSHVGLAIGNGEFIHAPSERGVVRIERLDAPYWRDRTLGAKRLF